MDIFLPALLSFSFKALIVLFPIVVILKILRNLYIDKTINAYVALPVERKERIIRLFQSAISMWRIFLWVMPFCFLLFLVLFVLLFMFPEFASAVPGIDIRQFVIMMVIASVLGYVHIAEDSYYKKKILKALEKSTEREML